MTAKNWFRFILMCIFWGTNYLWNRIIVVNIGPFMLVFFRVLLAFFTIFFYVVISKTRIVLTWKKVGIYLVLGFFYVTLPFLAASWAQQSITSGMAGIISSTNPLFALLLATIFLPQERISGLRAVGLLIGFLGAVILASSGLTNGQSGNSLSGILVMLVSSISYAVALVFTRATAQGMDEKEQSLGQISFALITITMATLLFESQWRLPSRPIIWIGVVSLGILYTGAGTILWFALLNSAGVMYASLVSYVAPVIAVILGVLILAEKFTWQLLVGGALVLCGVMWVNSCDTQKT